MLFLCVHNSARSQMAEALLRARAGDRFEAFSAGSDPTRVHPFALRMLQDRGIDASRQHSKSVDEFANQRFDYVITLCAEEICPTFPNAATRLHWDLPDPTGKSIAHYRIQRDAIKLLVQEFIAEIRRSKFEPKETHPEIGPLLQQQNLTEFLYSR